MGLQSTNHRGDTTASPGLNAGIPRARVARALILIGISLAAWPNGASAQSAEFKCYVIAEDSTTHLRLTQSKDLRHAQMFAAQPLKLSKKRVLDITQVVECQPAQSSFVDPAARLLDERTPR